MSAAVSRIVAGRVLSVGRVSTVLVVVVLAVTAAGACGLVAGARRTASAFDRYVTSSAAWDLTLGGGPDDQEARVGELRDVPAVADMISLPTVGLVDVGTPGIFGRVFVDIEGRLDRFMRPKILEGHLPAPDMSDEVVLGAALADRLHVGVGDRVPVQVFDGTTRSLRVAAVAAFPTDFPTLTSLPIPIATVPQGFATAHPEAVSRDDPTWLVRLVDGADGLDAFLRAKSAAGLGAVDIPSEMVEQRDGMRRILRTQAHALWLAAAVTASAGLIACYQLLRRAAGTASSALAKLRTLGARRLELVAGGGLRGLAVGVIAATLAGIGAVALSTLFPRGSARLAEPDPGVHGDVIVLAAGAFAVIIAGAGLSAFAVWSATKGNPRPTLIRAVPVPAGGPVASGVRFALESESRGVGNLHPGLLGLGLITAILVAVSTVATSVDHLLVKPELTGGWWDVAILPGDGDASSWEETRAALLEELRDEPAIVGVARGGWVSDATLHGRPIPIMTVEPGTGINPAMRSGRAPVGPLEIALGTTTMEELDVAVGDVVDLRPPESPGAEQQASSLLIPLTVVGEVVLTSPNFIELGPGEGALVSYSFLERWMPGAATATPLLVRLPDVNPLPPGVDHILEGPGEEAVVIRAERGDVAGLRDLETVPFVLALGIGALTLATIAHRVVMSARRHRRDYGVLRSLGATLPQVRLGVTAQASSVALVAFLIGIPLGLLLAYLTWPLVADELIVVPVVRMASPLLAGIAILAVALTALVGLSVGRGMRHHRPAELLRAE